MKRKITTDITYIKQKSKEVSPEGVETIVKDLEDSLEGQRGIGLAAIQVGIPLQVAIIKIPNREPMNLYNPKIIDKQDPIKFSERCLSLPGLDILTRRYNDIVWENGDGQRYSAGGIEAICVQHEIDHMNGLTILDRKWRRRK